jgi:hypothetical protein
MQWIVITIFIVLRIVFSISKAANQNGQKQRVQAEPGRKRRVQSEIEAFLSEVTGGKQPDKRDDAELARQRQAQRNAETKRLQRDEKQRRSGDGKKKSVRREQKASTSKSRHRGERKVGFGVAAHVDEFIGKHVSEHINHDVDEYVEATIVDSVDEHLGRRVIEMPTMATSSVATSSAAASVAKMLRNPEGVRNAIIVNEILSRPRALRR